MSINGKCATAAASWLATLLARPFKPVCQTLVQRGRLLARQSGLLLLVRD